MILYFSLVGKVPKARLGGVGVVFVNNPKKNPNNIY